MPRIKTVEISAEQKAALEKGAAYGSTPSFRLRCQAILLKTEQRTSVDIAQELGCCEMSINDWMKRFDEQGVEGLKVAKGRGRKPILKQETDFSAIKQVVIDNRQRLRLAQAELNESLGKEFSLDTLKRFLKKTSAVTNE
jgi:transposase